MYESLIFFLFLLIVVVIHFTLAPLIQILGVGPDIILIYLVYWSVRRESYKGVIAGFVGGIIQDLVQATIMGIYSLSKSIACFFAGYIMRNKKSIPFILLIFTLFITVFIHQMIYSVFTSLHSAGGYLSLVLRYLIPSSFYTMVVGVAVYGSIELWKKKKRGG